jgi:hypothetical protein
MQTGLSTSSPFGNIYAIEPRVRSGAQNEETSSASLSQEKETSPQEKERAKDPDKLTASERQVVTKLQARDTEVRAHEAAHQAAGGGLTGGASFTYQKGPDERMYAIGGEVSISTKEGSTPEETIQIARQVIAAAMAPADPSPQDYAVASSATMMMLKAQQQKAREMQEQAMGLESYKNGENMQKEKKGEMDISA